jgi:hypothetical protein
MGYIKPRYNNLAHSSFVYNTKFGLGSTLISSAKTSHPWPRSTLGLNSYCAAGKLSTTLRNCVLNGVEDSSPT